KPVLQNWRSFARWFFCRRRWWHSSRRPCPPCFDHGLCADGLKIVGRGSSRCRRQTHRRGSEKRLTDLRAPSKQLLSATTTGTATGGRLAAPLAYGTAFLPESSVT